MEVAVFIYLDTRETAISKVSLLLMQKNNTVDNTGIPYTEVLAERSCFSLQQDCFLS